MARLPVCSGAPIAMRKLYVALTYPAVQVASSLGLTLPTSEPSTPQISYTIAASDAPNQAGNFTLDYTLHPLVWARGRNTGTSSTISYRLKKNGASVATGSLGSCAQNYYYTITAGYKWGATPPVVGDVIELALWASGASVSLTDIGFGCSASRFMKNKNPLTLLFATAFQETAGTFKPSWASTSSREGYYLGLKRSGSDGFAIDLGFANAFECAVGRPDYGFLRIRYGDVEYYTTAEMSTSSSASTSYAYSPRRVYQIRAVELVVPGNIGFYGL